MANETSNMCVVCCHKITIYAVGVCEHSVCHQCSTRMRVLCNQNDCPICRQTMPEVYFTSKCLSYNAARRRFESCDRQYGLYFESKTAEEAYRKLLEYRCNMCDDYVTFDSFAKLKTHMRTAHERFYCDLCIQNVKLFCHERKAYLRPELARHRRIGDPDDTSHRGHPNCEFCNERYMDQDDLFRHLRKDHFYCHFCDADGHHVFYSGYADLRDHFASKHFLCEEGTCKNEEFTSVFRTEIDLKAHKAVTHSRSLTKAQAKQARTLDVGFTYTPRNDGHRPYDELYAMAEPNDSIGARLKTDGNIQRKKTFKPRESARASSPEPIFAEPTATKKYTPDMSQDFPNLDGTAGNSNPLLTAPTAPAWRSSSKRLTESSNSDEMFPSLTPNAPPNWPNKTQVQVPKKPMRPLQNSKPPPPATQQNTNRLAIKSEDDFPSLPKPPSTSLITTDRFVSFNSTVPQANVSIVKPQTTTKPVQSRPIAAPKLTGEDFPQLPEKINSERGCGKENGERKSGKSGESRSANYKNSVGGMNWVKELEKSDYRNLAEVADSLKGNVQVDKKSSKDGNVNNKNNNNNDKDKLNSDNNNKKPVTQPPPGIAIRSADNTKETFSTNNGLYSYDNTFSSNIPPRSYVYIEPSNFKTRNYELITKVKSLMQNDAGLFLEFRTLSGQFRQNATSATNYCEVSINLIGEDGFLEVFPELIVLLPDIQKQKELLAAYKTIKSGLRSKAKSKVKVVSCAECQQVLSAEDLTVHMIMHK